MAKTLLAASATEVDRDARQLEAPSDSV